MGIRIFGIAGSTNAAEDFRLAASGIFAAASALNNRAGVLTTPVLTGTGSFTATVGPFVALVDGTSNSLQGSYWVAVDVATTITIGAASAQARVDLISLQIQDNAYDSSGFQRGQLVVTAGTPGAGVPPTTPANAVALWNVPVGASASSVTFTASTAVFPYTAATGGIIPVRGATDQPTVVDGVQYRHRLDLAAGGSSPTEWSTNGTTWNSVFDAVGGAWSTWAAVTSIDPAFAAVAGKPVQYRTGPGGLAQLRGALTNVNAIGAIAGAFANLPFSTVTPPRFAIPHDYTGTTPLYSALSFITSQARCVITMTTGTLPAGTTFFLDATWCTI